MKVSCLKKCSSSKVLINLQLVLFPQRSNGGSDAWDIFSQPHSTSPHYHWESLRHTETGKWNAIICVCFSSRLLRGASHTQQHSVLLWRCLSEGAPEPLLALSLPCLKNGSLGSCGIWPTGCPLNISALCSTHWSCYCWILIKCLYAPTMHVLIIYLS